MPELPEVEEVRRTLEPHLLGHAVMGVRIIRHDFISPRRAPLRLLLGRRFTRTQRHGKKMFLTADDGQTLHLHLGMTGHVDCVPSATAVRKHTHLILALATGTDVRFRDPRRFGGLWYYTTLAQALTGQTAKLGPDALTLTPAHLAHWRTTRGRLKQRLLAQHDVAGLGNIYVDEALWLSGLHPRQCVRRITAAQVQTLAANIRKILRRSLAHGGTTIIDYRNAHDQSGRFARLLKAYGRAGQPCYRCQTPLTSATIAGRTTVFCASCQKCH